MKIAVNTRLLLKNRLEGIGWYTFETLRRIVKAHPEHSFYFLFDRPYDSSFVFEENVTPVVLSPQARHPILFMMWFDISVNRFLRKNKIDIFLSPDGYLSLRTKTPSLAVIHDLNFEHYPKDLPWVDRKYYQYFFPRFAHKARRIATVSEYSKRDISKQYNVPLEKIDVTLNGMNNKFSTIDESEKVKIRTRFSDSKPFFLFVGALHPRKNLTNMFLAFDKFKSEKQSDVKFVIVGEKKWWTKSIANVYENMKFKDEVIFLGRRSAEELCQLMASSLALVYVSYFEGFGIPILEAFACGTAVITSNVTSMPEVAGDAAILVDPFSVDEIADAMEQVSSDEDFRNNLIEKANIRKDKFSWDVTANQLWKSVEKLINEISEK
ncbi:MAG: glycosyltransferase family 4 protein [Bacteroidales bacterium]|jgi:glycosyltransferase involved in cell wall biosynthesis|nr:glycosyltransferase family 4 protein [Bacteroidales bacterium]